MSGKIKFLNIDSAFKYASDHFSTDVDISDAEAFVSRTELLTPFMRRFKSLFIFEGYHIINEEVLFYEKEYYIDYFFKHCSVEICERQIVECINMHIPSLIKNSRTVFFKAYKDMLVSFSGKQDAEKNWIFDRFKLYHNKDELLIDYANDGHILMINDIFSHTDSELVEMFYKNLPQVGAMWASYRQERTCEK
jgi:hypothetical protein